MAVNRESSREALIRRMRESQDRQNSGRSGLFKQGVSGIKLWTPDSQNSNIIDIIPYQAGDNDPFVEQGDWTYLLEVYVHSNVGSSEGMTLCRAQTYPQGSIQGPLKCPICQDLVRKQREGAPDNIIKMLKPKRYPRTLYNIIAWNNREQENKGTQIFHTSAYLLEMYLREMAKKTTSARPGGDGKKAVEATIPFMDMVDGRSIVFKKEGEKDTTKFIGIRFEERDYDLSQYIADRGLVPFCLDEILYVPSYEEVENIYYGDEGGKPTGEQATRRGRNADDAPADARPSGRGRNADPEPEPSSRGARRADPEPEPEEDPPPRRRGRAADPEPEPDDDPPPRRRGRAADPEPEPEPEPRRRARQADPEPEEEPEDRQGKKSACPSGYKYGADVDKKDECAKCGAWEGCAKFANELKKQEGKKADPEPDDDPPPRRRGRAADPEPEPEEDPPPRRRTRQADPEPEPENDPPPRRRARQAVEEDDVPM